jgi:hypothetical protein
VINNNLNKGRAKMKKALSFCICLLLIAGSASAELFKRDAAFEAKMMMKAQGRNSDITMESIQFHHPDAKSFAQSSELEAALAPLYEQILELKANHQSTEDLWNQVRSIRSSMGFDTRSNSNTLDQGGDNCTDAIDLGSYLGPNADFGSTVGFANDFGPYTSQPSCWQGAWFGASAGSADVTYLWTAPYTGSFTFSLCNDFTDYDSGLELYTPCSDIAGPIFLCGNDDACGLHSRIFCYPLQQGERVLIVIDGYGINTPLTGNYQLDILPCCDEFECPPDAIFSQEPPCSPDYVDFFNYGCPPAGTTLPPAFEPIECNTTVCGNSGSWVGQDGSIDYDWDWYVLNLTQESQVEVCLGTTSQAYSLIAAFTGECGNGDIVFYQESEPSCDENCYSACLPAGVYYFMAALDAPCGTPYALSVSCGPCDDCLDGEQIYVDVSGGLPVCQCITLPCVDTFYYLCMGPLGPNEIPVSAQVTPGCSGIAVDGLPILPCDEECPPTTPFQIGELFYDPIAMTWCVPIAAETPGCFCFCLDDILPVELNEFNAIAGDGEAVLNWSTASESDNDHFDITRDGTIVGRVTAANSPSGQAYHWVDQNLSNGRSYDYELIAVSISGTRETMATASATPAATSATVTEYALHQNYPNPFNPETSITFDVAEASQVMLTVYNPLGQTVATLVNGTVEAGRHSVSFDAANLPSGLYFYRMDAGQFSAIKKMVLMK